MELTGRAKAAIFLLSLDEKRAVRVIEHLNEEELKTLRVAVEELGPVSVDILEQVYSEFTEAFRTGLAAVGGGSEYLEALVAKAIGEDEALRLFSPPPPPPEPPPPPPPPPEPLASFAAADPRTLSLVLAGEHPQLLAAVLAYLDPEISSAILLDRSVEEQADLVRRIATLKKIPLAAMRDVEMAIGALGLDIADRRELDGITSAATILNKMIEDTATDVLDRIGEEYPEHAEKIRHAMFTFEDLVGADTRGVQMLLREIQSDQLLVALKTASEEVRQKIYGCISQRAAAMLQEELEVMPPIRVSDVHNAQQEIVDTAMRLMAQGKMSVLGRGEQMV
ncbi:MAG: flagellar motor switch protein FliG [Pseudomonadota bacterium]